MHSDRKTKCISLLPSHEAITSKICTELARKYNSLALNAARGFVSIKTRTTVCEYIKYFVVVYIVNEFSLHNTTRQSSLIRTHLRMLVMAFCGACRLHLLNKLCKQSADNKI